MARNLTSTRRKGRDVHGDQPPRGHEAGRARWTGGCGAGRTRGRAAFHGGHPGAHTGDGSCAGATARLHVLHPTEAAFIEAAVARLIPADDLGPGAREAGCAFFIDQQLAGAFGSAARWYMQGPFGDASPEQGYQLPLTPRQLYRLGIEQVNLHCAAALGKTFDRLDPAAQDAVLQALEQARLPTSDLPQQAFFSMLLANTVEGFFADPIYGGNHDKVGWTLVGFPGVAAAYVADVASYNVPYQVEPVSIADIVRGQADLDAHGHPVHRAVHDAGHEPR